MTDAHERKRAGSVLPIKREKGAFPPEQERETGIAPPGRERPRDAAPNGREREKGATLIEVIGATAILGIVVAAFLYLSQHLALMDRVTSAEAQALLVAEEKLNFARAYVQEHQAAPPAEPDAGGFSVVYQLSPLCASSVTYDTDSFGPKHLSLQSVVLLEGSGGTFQPMLLTATVSWEE